MAKKDFKENNPALAFISTQETQEQEQEETPRQTEQTQQEQEQQELKAPEGYKINHLFVETKSKRIQLLMQPSVLNALKDLAQEENTSMNNLANEAIKEYLKNKGKYKEDPADIIKDMFK